MERGALRIRRHGLAYTELERNGGRRTLSRCFQASRCGEEGLGWVLGEGELVEEVGHAHSLEDKDQRQRAMKRVCVL